MDALNSLNNLSVGGANVSAGSAASSPAAGTPGTSFKDVLMKNLSEVNDLQQDADKKIEDFVTGRSQNMGEIISASQKATMAFNMLTQIRNKLQDAYDEVKNLRV
ncbi:MAG TPA: flagellar hook-basal body complex protein FliE [Phycisphaerae bacterium]|nr:flagellar hook-basal body complex protein FliE [Phycisphaerae bacterium]